MKTEQPKRIRDSLSLGRKMGIVIDHLQNNGELTIDGHTWVWSDDHDGLSLKCTRISGNVTSDHIIGQADMPLNQFIAMLNEIEEIDWFGITASIALRSLNKQR